MSKILIIYSLVFISCSLQYSESDLLNKKDPEGFYGNKIGLKDFQSFNNLISYPDKYLGKDVLISGEIIEVCPMRGCWIRVKDNNSDLIIRVKVTDGLIVFPLSSKGKFFDVQGEFSKLDFTEEQAMKWKIHLAEEKGIVLSPKDVVINPSDLLEYRVIGNGAQIYTYGCK